MELISNFIPNKNRGLISFNFFIKTSEIDNPRVNIN